ASKDLKLPRSSQQLSGCSFGHLAGRAGARWARTC
ncbi:hypothetical protein A2U01_0104093, partial [Trifolium medium]|nr:hypothetical protein [Trifolium medium]